VTEPLSLQLVGSKAMGGAERWFLRFAVALGARGARAELGIRRGSDLDDLAGNLPPLPLHRLPFLSVWDPWSRLAVSRLIRRRRPDLVQTYMGRATRLTRLSPDPNGGRGPIHVARLGGYYKLDPYLHAHAWIGNTRGLCDWMVRQGLPAGRVFHIYNFADPVRLVAEAEVAALRATLALPRDALVLLTPGRFVPVKGHADLLEAMAILPCEIGGRPLRLILLGDGPLRPELERQASRLGIADRLVWPGWQTDPGPFFCLADQVVFPSADRSRPLLLSCRSGGLPVAGGRDPGERDPRGMGLGASPPHQPVPRGPRDRASRGGCLVCPLPRSSGAGRRHPHPHRGPASGRSHGGARGSTGAGGVRA
jgi:L-malate glycosyltransferase